MTIELLFHDAQGTDGSDLSQVVAVYRYNGQDARIPANTPQDKVESQILAALGLDPAEESQKQADLSSAKAGNIEAALDQIETDLTALSGSPTAAVLRQILSRSLERQRIILKALRHLVAG